jgi:hypothetical protein
VLEHSIRPGEKQRRSAGSRNEDENGLTERRDRFEPRKCRRRDAKMQPPPYALAVDGTADGGLRYER